MNNEENNWFFSGADSAVQTTGRQGLPRALHRPAYAAGWAMEGIYAFLRISSRPILTRLAVEIFGTNLGFSIEKARRELGYEPRIAFEEGMDRVAEWLQATGHLAPLPGRTLQ